MRARCATNSQRTKRLVPIDERADSRSQIPREKFWGGGKTGREFKLENLLNRFLFMLRIL